jgi:LCP family protein required for cell wall assembly
MTKRKRIVILSVSAGMAALLAVVAVGGLVLLKHFNGNIQQYNLKESGLLGHQPVDAHPQAENILVLGSDTRNGQGSGFGTGLVTDQSDTTMIVHIPADRKWAEVMSIPRDSWVGIPACKMGNGQLSAPHQFKINEAFAIGNLYGNHTALGVACTIKTIEQDTGIYIDHFIVVNFTGFKDMVAALGGVPECNPTPIDDPLSGLHLTAGHHLLTPKQALGYVRARYTLGNGTDLERIGRQQAFMSSLIARVQAKMLDPLAIYRFLDAATQSLTIDSQLGGVTGLYNLGESLRGIPKEDIAFFTLPNAPLGDGASVAWVQPEDDAIFKSFRDDVPASSSLFAAPAGSGTSPLVAGAAAPQGTTGFPGVGATPGTRSPARTASPPVPASHTVPASRKGPASPSAGASVTQITSTPAPTATTSASASPGAASRGPSLQARTANQSICAG